MKQEEFRTKEELLSEIAQLEAKLSKLDNSESKFRIWLENSPICTKILDLDFNLQYMSSSGIKDLKIDDISEFYGKPFPFNSNPDYIKTPMLENLKRARETGKTITHEAHVQDLEGNILWYQATIVPVYNDDDQLDHIMVVSINTTDRRQAENDLKKSRGFLNSIYNGTNLAIAVADINEAGEFRYTGVNKHHENTFGIKNEEYTGKTPKQLEKLFGKQTMDFITAKYDLCVKTKSVLEYEMEIPDKSGKKIIWSNKITPLFD